MDKMPQQQQIQVELDEKAAEGIYSNFVLTAHNAAEFVLDFARLVPGVPKAKVHARVIMTPQSAKSLSLALADAIGKFENNFGKINVMPRGNQPGSIGFQSGPGEDLEKKKN
ncbi:MAG: DUF3467 domain-containing protein [Candidatus Latescibacterota bacterium]|nr:MAG: DUF3467 domain-containing protein [Candidatus Latescibacterota bacterium]